MRALLAIFLAVLFIVALCSSTVETCAERGGKMEDYDCHRVLTCNGADGDRLGIDCHFTKRCKARCSLEAE